MFHNNYTNRTYIIVINKSLILHFHFSRTPLWCSPSPYLSNVRPPKTSKTPSNCITLEIIAPVSHQKSLTLVRRPCRQNVRPENVLPRLYAHDRSDGCRSWRSSETTQIPQGTVRTIPCGHSELPSVPWRRRRRTSPWSSASSVALHAKVQRRQYYLFQRKPIDDQQMQYDQVLAGSGGRQDLQAESDESEFLEPEEIDSGLGGGWVVFWFSGRCWWNDDELLVVDYVVGWESIGRISWEFLGNGNVFFYFWKVENSNVFIFNLSPWFDPDRTIIAAQLPQQPTQPAPSPLCPYRKMMAATRIPWWAPRPPIACRAAVSVDWTMVEREASAIWTRSVRFARRRSALTIARNVRNRAAAQSVSRRGTRWASRASSRRALLPGGESFSNSIRYYYWFVSVILIFILALI